jgi:hypothetical protein
VQNSQATDRQTIIDDVETETEDASESLSVQMADKYRNLAALARHGERESTMQTRSSPESCHE